MAVCPNCKKKLRFTDVSQNCPHCGVNMRFFGYDERFYHDAKKAELSAARLHVFIKTLKAALIGSRLAAVRFVSAFLPAAALLVPAAKARVSFPFLQTDADLSAVGGYNAVNGGILSFYPVLLRSPVNGGAATLFLLAAGAFLLTALTAVLLLLTTLLSFTGIRRTAKANCALAAAGIVFTAACAILSAVTKAISGFDGAVISCAPSFGWPLQAAAFAVFFAANLLVLKKGLPVLPAEGMRERVEIAKKVRRGELRLDDLPQPVVETAETRKIEEQIRAAKTEYEEKRQKREAEAHEKA